MNFLYPSFLFAVAAIAIPIAIHLFNFQRYKTISFTNVQFLKEIKEETRQRSELKHLLVLLCRILFILFLVFAFSQPFIPLVDNPGNIKENQISIYIDNSFSMEGINEEGRLLDQAKKKAIEIAKAYKASDQFQLLTNNFESQHQKFFNREEFIKLTEEVEIGPSFKLISEVINRQKSLFSDTPEKNSIIFLLSDFQKNNTDINAIVLDSGVHVKCIPLSPQETNNLYIDSCWFESPVRKANTPDKLWVRVRAIGETEYKNTPIKLSINQQQKALASFNLKPNQYTDVPLAYTLTSTGIKNCVVSITDYPVAFDDRTYLSYDIPEKLNILSISDTGYNKYTDLIYNQDDHFVLSTQLSTQIDYSELQNNNLIVLSNIKELTSGMGQELKKFVSNGGTLCIFPGKDCETDTYKNFLKSDLNIHYFTKLDTQKRKVNWLNLKHEIFKDVFNDIPERIDMPKTKMHYSLSNSIKSNMERVLSLDNGTALLSNYKKENGNIFLFTVPLNIEASNLPEHSLFVPIMYNIAINSQQPSPISYTIGIDNKIETTVKSIDDQTSIPHIKKLTNNDQSDGFDIIPDYKVHGQVAEIYVHGQINEAGNYYLMNNETPSAGISFNFDRKESELAFYNTKDIEKDIEINGLNNISTLEIQSESAIKQLKEMNQGKQLWKLCIIFALAFLSIEILLLRLWK